MKFIRSICVLLVSALLVPGCINRRAPGDWLPERDVAGASGNGGYVTVKLKNQPGREIGGELLAATYDSLYLVSLPPGNFFYAIPKDSVRWARVEYCDVRSSVNGQIGLTVLGIVGSITTGWFSFLLSPLYLITGIITGANISFYGSTDYDADDRTIPFEDFQLYARFPSGLPKTFDRSKAKTNAPNLQ